MINLFDDDRLVDGGGEKILEKFVVFTISHLSFDDDDDDDGKMHLAADDDRFSMKKKS